MADEREGVDLSGLHRELDRLKTQLCRCQHQGTCLACKGFEILREQSQMVVAAASQPVLMQVAQEAAIKDLVGQLGGVQEKLAEDPHLQATPPSDSYDAPPRPPASGGPDDQSPPPAGA